MRDTLTKEICLIKQALEWGDDGTPSQHWDQLVAIRGSLCDLNHNLGALFSKLFYKYSNQFFAHNFVIVLSVVS